jgi:hypothetical protein
LQIRIPHTWLDFLYSLVTIDQGVSNIDTPDSGGG